MYENRTRGRDGIMVNEDLARDAEAREEIALRLSLEAMRQAQRAAVGLFALPATVALGVAASVSYATALLERGFQIFEVSLGKIARDVREPGRLEGEAPFASSLPATGEAGEKAGKSVRS